MNELEVAINLDEIIYDYMKSVNSYYVKIFYDYRKQFNKFRESFSGLETVEAKIYCAIFALEKNTYKYFNDIVEDLVDIYDRNYDLDSNQLEEVEKYIRKIYNEYSRRIEKEN